MVFFRRESRQPRQGIHPPLAVAGTDRRAAIRAPSPAPRHGALQRTDTAWSKREPWLLLGHALVFMVVTRALVQRLGQRLERR
jgi:hypothetical protein